MNRRDKCDMIAARAGRLTGRQAEDAWHNLAGQVKAMGFIDVPKFNDLLRAVRAATIFARKTKT